MLNLDRKCATCDNRFVPKVIVGRDFSYCSECKTKRRKLQWLTKKEILARQNRNTHLKRNFGITIDMYDKMLIKQGGKCGICESTKGFAKRNGAFAVDHDSVTGKIRGLLCMPCNSSLGLLGHNIQTLQKAIEWLTNKGIKK